MSSSLVLVLLLGAYTTDSNESKTKKKKLFLLRTKILQDPENFILRSPTQHRKRKEFDMSQ